MVQIFIYNNENLHSIKVWNVLTLLTVILIVNTKKKTFINNIA